MYNTCDILVLGGVVPGLYVAGKFASGQFINDFGIKRQMINVLSRALASSFIAGESALRQIIL